MSKDMLRPQCYLISLAPVPSRIRVVTSALNSGLACSVLLTLGCGSPSEPSLSSPSPTAALSVTIDGGELTAIQAISVVTFDASQSTGSALRYRISFGDGVSADHAFATHVFAMGRATYKSQLTVTDPLGRIATTTADVGVASAVGSWTSRSYIPRLDRYETYQLSVQNHVGSTFSGTYYSDGQPAPFTGEVLPNRGLFIALNDGTMTFDGRWPNGFDSPAFSFKAMVSGGAADGTVQRFDSLYVHYDR